MTVNHHTNEMYYKRNENHSAKRYGTGNTITGSSLNRSSKHGH